MTSMSSHGFLVLERGPADDTSESVLKRRLNIASQNAVLREHATYLDIPFEFGFRLSFLLKIELIIKLSRVRPHALVREDDYQQKR